MRTVEEFGRTVEEAREKAFRALGIASAEDAGVEVEVLDEGSPGNDLGWGRKFARVKVTRHSEPATASPESEPEEASVPPEADVEDEPAPRREARPAARKESSVRGATKSAGRTSRPASRPASEEKRPRRSASDEDVDEAAHDLLDKMIDLMNINVSVEEEEGADGQTVLNIVGPDQGILIGKRGQTLDALQFILNLIVNKDLTERRRILLDAGGYRLRREKSLTDMALRLARRALEERVQIALEPMNPAERRIIHIALADDPDVETFSEGEEPERKVIISPRH